MLTSDQNENLNSKASSNKIIWQFGFIDAVAFRALAYALLFDALGNSESSTNIDQELEISLNMGFGDQVLRELALSKYIEVMKRYYSTAELDVPTNCTKRGLITSKLNSWELAMLFNLHCHLLTGSNVVLPREVDFGPLVKHDVTIGVYCGGKTVLKRFIFDLGLKSTSEPTLIIADGLPLGLPVTDDGAIVVSFRRDHHGGILQGLNQTGRFLEGSSTTLRLDSTDTPGLRIDIEIDWEEDETKMFLASRQRGQRMGRYVYLKHVTGSKEFERIWIERAHTSICKCTSPSFQSIRSFERCTFLETSTIVNYQSIRTQWHLLTGSTEEARIPKNLPINGFLRRIYVANTKGCIVAQFRALELFHASVAGPTLKKNSYGTTRMNWEPIRGDDEPREETEEIFVKYHFVSCLRCWERDVVEEEEAWYQRWINSAPTPRNPTTTTSSLYSTTTSQPNTTIPCPPTNPPAIRLISFIIAV